MFQNQIVLVKKDHDMVMFVGCTYIFSFSGLKNPILRDISVQYQTKYCWCFVNSVDELGELNR